MKQRKQEQKAREGTGDNPADVNIPADMFKKMIQDQIPQLIYLQVKSVIVKEIVEKIFVYLVKMTVKKVNVYPNLFMYLT